MYIYLKSEPGLFTVGHYAGEQFHSESDHDTAAAAAERVHWLNGGNMPDQQTITIELDCSQLRDRVHAAAVLRDVAHSIEGGDIPAESESTPIINENEDGDVVPMGTVTASGFGVEA